MPRLPAGLVEALLRRTPAYCVDAPVLGHWPVSALDDLMTLLCVPAKAVTQPGLTRSWENSQKKTGPSIKSWAHAIGAIPIESPSPIANVNTPADLLAL